MMSNMSVHIELLRGRGLCSRGMEVIGPHPLDNLTEVEVLAHVQVLDDLLMRLPVQGRRGEGGRVMQRRAV